MTEVRPHLGDSGAHLSKMKAVQVQNKASLLCQYKVVAKEKRPRRMTPSAFTQKMLQSTEERLNNTTEVNPPRILEWFDTSNTIHQKFSVAHLERPLFQPFPSELVFQNFTPLQTYKLPLILLNNDKVLRHVKLEQPESEDFFVVGPVNPGTKVAPGMSITFTVGFTPKENKDYEDKLICVTERERFEIPVRAIGPRAILDFRDEILFPVCLVKASTQKTHLLRNIGNSQAKFKLHTQQPFSVKPSSGTLDVGESLQVTVSFHPLTVGDHREDLLLHYHTGEDVFISLCGSCEELNIHLEPECVTLKSTYISLTNVHTVTLTNSSDTTLQYCWTMWPSLEVEEQSSQRKNSALLQEEEEEAEGRGLFKFESGSSAAHHFSVPSGALEENDSQTEEDHLLGFSFGCITVNPLKGEIWPNTTAQFSIIFKPEEAKLYHHTVYCDVTGCESNLPLTIVGEGLGPELELSYSLMDMNNVFISDKDHYEVQMSNVGFIEAVFRFSVPDTTFGRCFSICPEEGVVPPGACQNVDVIFQSSNLGTFSEDLLLNVEGQPHPLTLTFRGCVIGPTFHFSVFELNFGDVAFGFPATSTCTLFNTSFVPMDFYLRVLGDGSGPPSVSSACQVSDSSRKNWKDSAARVRPVEFTVIPAGGSVRAMSEVNIKVTLCSNTVKVYRLALVVDVLGVGEEVMTLPINARCVVPEVFVEPPVLDFQRCFLRHTYKQQIVLTNPGHLPACYGILDQKLEEDSSVFSSTPAPRGLILPGSSVELPVLLQAQAVGQLHHTLRIAIFGSQHQPLEVLLSCFGQGPVVHLQNTQIHFGRIAVLKDVARPLQLFNQSPIPAHFTVQMNHRGSFWRVEPSEGEVPAESQVVLKVVAHLKDTLQFQDKLKVSIRDSQTLIVSVSATGTGTTIVSDKPLGPNLDLGTFFSHGLYQYHFKLTNQGQRVHRMYWKIDSTLPSKRHKEKSLPERSFLPPISPARQRDTHGSSLPSSREKPTFSLSPSRVELFPGCSADMVLTATSDFPQVVRERLVCHGIIGRQGSQETIMTVDLSCRFVAPILSISAKKLDFFIKKVKGEKLLPLFEKLLLKNVSSLSLSVELRLAEPFFLCDASGEQSSATRKSLLLGDGKQAELWVCFNPSFCQDRQSRVVDEYLDIMYSGHPQQDVVELHAEVHFPNLHFSSTMVDFGCVFNGTESHKVLTVTNCSLMPVSYRWAFLDSNRHPKIRKSEIADERKWRKSSSPGLLPALSPSPQSPGPDKEEQRSELHPVCLEEVFDILPMFGDLQPGDEQFVTFSFFGHKNISREVVAQCRVKDGPTYEIQLRGEASEIRYSLDSTCFDFGLLPFQTIGEIDFTLRNTGKVGFEFSFINPEADDESSEQMKMLQEAQEEIDLEALQVWPGKPLVIPAVGYIDAGTELRVHVLYLPGIPEGFQKQLQLQVTFLPPEDITLRGMGVFPRISLNLPRNLSEDHYSNILEQAKATVEADRDENPEALCTFTYEELLHMEMEHILIREKALITSETLLNLHHSHSFSPESHRLSELELPEYILDFGFVIPGKDISKTVNVINNGLVPVSFHANCKRLAGTGFTAEFKKVKNLPCGETETFSVKFDPQRAKLKMGNACVILPIQVSGGPVVRVQLCAEVTMPTITVSENTLQFDTVQHGNCQMKTMQLSNQQGVPCRWRISEEIKPVKKIEKFLPLHLRRKALLEQQPPPAAFECIPSSGVLFPGERSNVFIKFTPDEGCSYNRRLQVCVDDSTQQVFISAHGQGEEPQLEFWPPILEMDPCLPYFSEAEAEVTVRNPCSFPVEFYSLEFDTQYLEEEKILRLMEEYDENNLLLLPPRLPGEGLPKELLEYYKEYSSLHRENEINVGLEVDGAEGRATQEEDRKSKQNNAPTEIRNMSTKLAETFVSELSREGGSGRLGQLERSPVFRAIARHMGYDLSTDALMARNRRGIAVIVYGAPLTDKSRTAAALSHRYGAACLSIDDVVKNAIHNGTSAISITARKIYEAATARCAQRRPAQVADAADPRPATRLETTLSSSISASLDSVENEATAQLVTADTSSVFCPGEVNLCRLLPEQLLADILAERFQLRDCLHGVVIDGLQSAFTHSASSALLVVLKALSNRKHIYVVNLSDSYDALKERERQQREAEESLQRQRDEREERRLQDLDDEEYEALSEEEKALVQQIHMKRLQQEKARQLEQLAKEKEEKRKQEEEMQRQKEENMTRKSKKGGRKDSKDSTRKKNFEAGHSAVSVQRMSSGCNSKESFTDTREQLSNEVYADHQTKEQHDLSKGLEDMKRLQTESPKSADKLEIEKTSDMKRKEEDKDLNHITEEAEQREVSGPEEHLMEKEQLIINEGLSILNEDNDAVDPHMTTGETQTKTSQHLPKSEEEKPVVDELQCQFNKYELSQVEVGHILQHWDRARGLLLAPLNPGETHPWLEEFSTGKQLPGAVKKSKKGTFKTLSPVPTQRAASAEADYKAPLLAIPQIILKVMEGDRESTTELLCSTLPPPDEVLEDLGLGPCGPPIPPSTMFSVVPFPPYRDQIKVQQTCFRFLLPPSSDEEEESKDVEEETQLFLKEGSTTSKIIKKGSLKDSTVPKDRDKKVKEVQKNKRMNYIKTREKSSDGSREERSLSTFRWVVPAGGEVALRIWFYSETPGKFEQNFKFELVGTRRLYQLSCRGLCCFPSICKDYMTLFANSRKVPRPQKGLQRSYVIKPGYFEFGPLLCSKSRDRYKDGRYPENTVKLFIQNNSSLEAEICFSFQHDTHAATYLLDPPTMTLKPDQKQELMVWAYPTKQGEMKDCIVCQIRDNPEPVLISLSCWGVRPELELDNKHWHFGKVLVHREESRSVNVANKTDLPVGWRLQGVEELGDEFLVPQDQGVVPPNTSVPICMNFKAKKPLAVKKTLRLEVSDMENILGIVQTENIIVSAEAYNIDVEITPDCILDFGNIRVSEEVKLPLRLKNKGKYSLAFKLVFDQIAPKRPKLDSIFTVSPQSGTLMPQDKSIGLWVTCRPNKEVHLIKQPILLCQVIDPNVGKEDKVIAVIEIKISVQSFLSRYKITPAYDINFGPLVYGSKKSQTLTIENKGVFEFSFVITLTDQSKPGGSAKITVGDGVCAKPVNPSLKQRKESFQKDSNIFQNRLSMGVFSLLPSAGCLHPRCQQLITVDCSAEQLGSFSQSLLIDISGRDPSDHNSGIPYRLLAEVCRPGILLDMTSIFEEHHLCPHSGQLSSEPFCNAAGVYVLNENKFIFNKVLVGQTAKARFRLTNNSKVPCVLSLAVRNVGAKVFRHGDVFDLVASTLSVPNQSHAFAVVTFTPQSIQQYSAVFEATIEGASGMATALKSKVLEFEVIGESTLPSVCVLRPALKNSTGSPLLQFRRVWVGRKVTLPLILLNDGNVPAEVQIDMPDNDRVFTLKAAPKKTIGSIPSLQPDSTADSEPQSAHRAILKINPGETAEFEVTFCSNKPLSVKAKMSVQVKDNQYSSAMIQVTGEAYQEVVSLDNIMSTHDVDVEEKDEGNYELLDLGDCHVDHPHHRHFTMTNHSSNQALRFEWPPSGHHLHFSPQVGHLHAGCSKEVTVTFRASQPVILKNHPVKCKVCQVEFQQPIEKVSDWDDRQKTVQWQNASESTQQQPVIETDPEPSCSVVEGSQLDLKLCISAVCDYAKFSCSSNPIHFKDTMLFQTRVHHLQLTNEGRVKVEFSWKVFMGSNSSVVKHQEGTGSSHSPPGSRSDGPAVRPSSALASVMSFLITSPELPPFTVEPSSGTINPGVTQTFTIRFSPVEVTRFQGELLCSIPNLEDGSGAPCIPVYGCSLLPYCHFDLEDSDYLSQRSPDLQDPVNPNTRVLEFKTVGLLAASTRCFNVLNTTSKVYSFQWRCEDTETGPFSCLTPSGSIQPGKKVEMCFDYLPEQQDPVESFWIFLVESLSLSLPFLLVGTAREPLVFLNTPHLDFGEALVGHKVENIVDLVNREEEAVHFSILQSSLLSEDQQSSLILQPMTGTVASKDRLPLSVSFTPSVEGPVSFRLKLKVKKKSEPLTLTVKADCFAMNALLQLGKADEPFREIAPNLQESLDFGTVGVLELSVSNFLVTNLARFIMEVNFELTGPAELLQDLETKPQTAVVKVGKQLQASLLFCPRRICILQDVRLVVKVKLGPTFSFIIKGQAVAPSLEFSFTKFSFGKCFIHCPGMNPPSQTLKITNKSKRDISIECQFKNTDYLQVHFKADVLSPGALMEVPVTFYPRKECRYHEKLTFLFNSCIQKQVEILGQGVQIKLEVEDRRHKKLKLGTLLGQTVKKQIVLVNHSSINLSFTLTVNTNAQLDPKDLSVSPPGELKLRSNGGLCTVEIRFSPRQHIPPFTAELQAELADLLHPLLTIQGCCQGVEVKLDPDQLSFGAVVQRCQSRKRTVMVNTGDIGARFFWKTENFPAELSITPAKGYISPGMEVPLDVTFAPVELSSDSRYENLCCSVEGSSSPLTLTVTASCVTASTNKEMVNFVCSVRSSETKSLAVINPTNQRCRISPVVEGEHWTTAVLVTFEPHQNKTVDVTYRPLTMTTEEKKHLGSIFFSFPDGRGMLYSLQGTADPPRAEDSIVREITAKAPHTELLHVNNWLPRQQRFHVLLEMVKPEKHDATVSLKGPCYIDVPALSKRSYRMCFYAHREGQYNAKVTFRNKVTGEFLFYLVTFKLTPPGVLSTVELLTAARRTVSGSVTLENPLSTPICFTSECKCSDIFAPSQITVQGKSKGVLSFEYQPLTAGESTARLSLTSSELGAFHYDLLLKALPPPPEKPVHFSTWLGSSHTASVKFLNYSRSKTEYSSKIDCPDFTVNKTVVAPPGLQVGSEVSVEVCFEPHQLGEVKADLSLSSGIHGEYIFPLHGVCLPPKAQGPLSIKAGHSITIPFKNVFLQSVSFTTQVDNPCFTVKGPDSIKPKKIQNIQVSFEVPDGDPAREAWFGKLTVSSECSEGRSKPCSWVYYLKGSQ
ncbi:hydrocephalus-inducing protein homolog isoform X3 [Oryzias melastigma]|uniref:hydrocephalus-inducing protein homolog isoform X3 n=1 Tax=Oryzias melastigma TaxID=30732 RepID=UPI000CF7B899|nr:hydrocephalus-inducing protein homolog isoform X3 [Oryzias melastigma]